MRRYYIYLPLILILLLVRCSDNRITSPKLVSVQFPLSVGTYWEFQGPYHSLHREILRVQKGPDQRMWYRLETALFMKYYPYVTATRYTYLALEGDQLREYEFENCEVIHNILLQAPLSLGNIWLKYSSGTCATGPCDSLGPCPIIFRVGIDTRDSVLGHSDIATPLSNFKECIGLEEIGNYFEFRLAWFKPGVGFVKYEGFNLEHYFPGFTVQEDFVLTDFGSKRRLNLPDLSPSPSPALPSKAG